MALKATPPHDAMNRYLKEKRPEITDKTHYNYSTTLRLFCDWLVENGVTDLRDLDSDIIQQYKEYRISKVALITAKNGLVTIKDFIQFCQTIHAVPLGLYELIRIPKLSESDEISDEVLLKSEADSILEYLKKYEYGGPRHITLLILWKTGMRVSGIRGLDLSDFDESRPALELRHRPESDTPLKRKHKSERDVILTQETAEIIQDYIEHERPNVTDDYGREPLVSTQHGRRSYGSFQRHVYSATRPCYYSGSCPFDEEPETCEANTWNGASKCPGSVSPHALRRGYVTAARNAGQPKDITGDRVNMSGRILDKHYDKGTHDEKAERRREFLADI
jgi:integrase